MFNFSEYYKEYYKRIVTERISDTADLGIPTGRVDGSLSNNPEEPYLRSYAKRLDLDKIIKSEEDMEKFYKFTGPDFDWPPEFDIQDRELVIAYIIKPDHWYVEGEGEELATNTLAYHRLLKSNELDASKGSHVLIMNGQIKRYGGEISEDEHDRLLKQHPGMFYAPVKEQPPILIPIRRTSAIDDVNRKEWQVHIWLHCKYDPLIEATMSNIEYDNNSNRI
ncbi:hypothetical protein C2G38_2252584 [Gigaspora rosea]|uniref:Uncharacterized protein n=1 Tax=Gigaspora rosea TaxID=44941 RepID=A0A397UEB8_9GLOM|nr:hypothetical protein C2G38_2252584 [Gigaspora rosea]